MGPGYTDERERERVSRLTSAVALCVGAEALVVMRHLCGLTTQEAKQKLIGAARALLSSALSEAPASTTAAERS